ncbi:hypothetical protein [Nonomuraea longicatena]|uniref:GerMN domain-containing protein n=1 Tax=Nonomuraea longicatena TaxID=83682 RepID=A0ABP4APB3_9ACTN
MARRRQGKKRTKGTAETGGDPPQEEASGGGWKAARVWLAGIGSAVLIAAIGVVFTTWYTAGGIDAVDSIGGAPPLTIGHVAVDLEERPLVLREPVSDPRDRATLLSRATGDAEMAAVLARHRVATIGATNVTVVLTGNRSSLRIIDVRPRVLVRAPPADGALLRQGTAGEAGTVELVADLDRRPVRFAAKKEPRTAYFTKQQIDLKRDERVTLSLSIVGESAYYEFDLVATVLAEDRSEEVVINGPGGVPFRLTGPADSYRSTYRGLETGGWAPISTGRDCTAVVAC